MNLPSNNPLRALQILSACNRVMFTARDESAMLAEVVRVLVQEGGYSVAWTASLSVHGDCELHLENYYAKNHTYLYNLPQLPLSCLKAALETPVPPFICTDVKNSEEWQAWHSHFETHGYHSVALLPLRDSGRNCGVLVLHGNDFDVVTQALLAQIVLDLEFSCTGLHARQRRKFAKHEREDQFYLLFKEMLNGIIVFNTRHTDQPGEFVICKVNPAFEHLTGLRSIAIMGKRLDEVLPNLEAYWKQGLAQVMETGNSLYLSHYLKELDRYYEASVFIPKPNQLALAFNDITDRKQAESALQESERRYREFVESIPDIVYIYSYSQGALYYSPRVQDILGYTHEAFQAQPFLWHDAIHPEDLPKVDLAILDPDANKAFAIEYRVRDVHSVWHWFLDRFVRRQTTDTDFIIEGVATDITARKDAESALQRLATIVEQASAAIVMTDSNANIIYTNPFFTMATGYDQQEVLGMNPRFLQSGCQDKAFYRDLWATLVTGKTWSGRFINRRKDGSLYHEAATIFPITDENNIITHYASVKREITEQVKAEQALQQERALLSQRITARTSELSKTNSELRRAVRLKDEFLATMSHELRTPLNSILTLSEVLEEAVQSNLSPKQKGYFRTLRESAEHLLNLINDILDVSKTGAGQMQLDIQPALLNPICEASLSLVRQLAVKKNLQLTFIPDPEVTLINVDARRLKQIMVNLLGNAVKFTPEGGHIELSVHGCAEQGMLSLQVTDSGIGIPEQDIPNVFRPFVQLDAGLARHYAGTGLGLTLVARMTELHGGSVEVKSTPNQGSCFTVWLPWQSTQTSARTLETTRVQTEQTTETCRAALLSTGIPHLLVVDDTSHVRELLCDYFSNRGCCISSAATGREAVEQCLLLKPDLILMDIQMPDMDGFEATRRIRAESTLADTVIIAITALAMPGDKERCLQAGMQEYVSKPVALRELCWTVVKYLKLKKGIK